jgi:hypothetical protein
LKFTIAFVFGAIYKMPNMGFLPTRATFMMDFVVVAMVGVSLLLAFSIYLVRVKRQIRQHRNIQIATAILLAVTVIAFEFDIQFSNPHWTEQAKASPLFASGWVGRLLYLHLIFAIPTPFVWAYVIVSALRQFDSENSRFGNPRFARRHRFQGWMAALFLWGTAITGWVFYWAAFVPR